MTDGQITRKCAICIDYFYKPKFLPCYHTFCEDCLTDHIKARAINNKFTCPVCRNDTDVPEGGARGFQTNYYVEEVETSLRVCSKHTKTKLKSYCRECSVAICHFCRRFKHKNHPVDDLSTVEEEHKQQLKPLTEELEKKVAELKMFSENLTLTITDINTAADAACKNVDKQTEIICQQLREQAREIKQDIKQIQDDSKNTVQKKMEDINILRTGIETGVNYSRDVLTGNTTSKSAVRILPNIHSLIESGKKTSLDLPEVRYPLFSLVDIDTQCFRKLLGELDTEKAASFSDSFNTVEMNESKWYHSDVSILHGLSWRIGVFHRTTNLDVYLELTSGGDERESCTADATLKLVNHTDDSQSVVEKREGGEYTSDGMYASALPIDWKKLTDPNNGFLQNNRFKIVASVTVTKIDNE